VRLSITYDVGGNITSIIGSPTGSPIARLYTGDGENVTEIEVQDVPQATKEYLADLVQNHRVVLEGNKASLARK
jgi:hypothetical protein